MYMRDYTCMNDHEASPYLNEMTMELNHNSILKDKNVKVWLSC